MHRKRLVTLLALSAFFMPAVQAGDVEAGKIKALMCTGCHDGEGTRINRPEIYRIPKLAGQIEGYLVKALKDYRAGLRDNPNMQAIAASLSDQDIEDLAAYFASLPWE